jgi:hypothetical protein
VSRRAWKAMMDLLNCMLNGCLFGRWQFASDEEGAWVYM